MYTNIQKTKENLLIWFKKLQSAVKQGDNLYNKRCKITQHINVVVKISRILIRIIKLKLGLPLIQKKKRNAKKWIQTTYRVRPYCDQFIEISTWKNQDSQISKRCKLSLLNPSFGLFSWCDCFHCIYVRMYVCTLLNILLFLFLSLSVSFAFLLHFSFLSQLKYSSSVDYSLSI